VAVAIGVSALLGCAPDPGQVGGHEDLGDFEAPVTSSPSPEESSPDSVAAVEDGKLPADEAVRLAVRVRASGCGRVSTGSGFVLRSGVLVTNRHVVDEARRVQINTWDGASLEGRFVAVAFYSDLALVALDATPASPPILAETDPQPGDTVFAVGYPAGGPQTIEQGEVVGYEAAREFGDMGNVGNVMRITAQVKPGNSGGPLLDAKGSVAGVVYAVETRSGHGLALPVSTLRLLDERVQGGDVSDFGSPWGC
jgi:S1-C subfamily serine protease